MSAASKGFHSSISRRSFLEGLGVFGLATAATMGLAACSSSTSDSNDSSSSSSEVSTSGDDSSTASSGGSGKVLVAYYSAQGHTRAVAEELASDLSADVFEIVPANPYSDDDLNYNDEDSRVVQEYENEDQRDTDLAQDTPDNFADYDTVFVGYPIWWGDSAWAMHHFVTKNDFSGKTVVPFCTSLSSPLGSSGSNLADLAGTGDWQDGQRFSQDADPSDVQSWAQEF